MNQAAAFLCWISALGFGLPNLPAIRNVLEGRAGPLLSATRVRGVFDGRIKTRPDARAFISVCVLEG